MPAKIQRDPTNQAKHTARLVFQCALDNELNHSPSTMIGPRLILASTPILTVTRGLYTFSYTFGVTTLTDALLGVSSLAHSQFSVGAEFGPDLGLRPLLTTTLPRVSSFQFPVGPDEAEPLVDLISSIDLRHLFSSCRDYFGLQGRL